MPHHRFPSACRSSVAGRPPRSSVAGNAGRRSFVLSVITPFAAALALLLSAGCQSGRVNEESVEQGTPPPPKAPDGVESFGEALTPAKLESLAAILKDPDHYSGKSVTVEAKVRRACQKRGCWMEVAERLDWSTPGCRVTFKDYGFFVPKDSAGAHAKVQGTVVAKSISPEQVQHYEAEGASFPNKSPDGSAREVRLVATGVQLRR